MNLSDSALTQTSFDSALLCRDETGEAADNTQLGT